MVDRPKYPLPQITTPPRMADMVFPPGEPMETPRHTAQMVLLIGSLREHWRERDDFFVGGQMFFYFSELQTRKHDFRGPDILLTMNTHRGERKAWAVWEEDGRVPDVIIELLSETTHTYDRGEKKDAYARVKVPEYFLSDPETGELLGFELDVVSGSYRPKVPNDAGRLVSLKAGLELGAWVGEYHGITCTWCRWFEADGTMIPTPDERAEVALEEGRERGVEEGHQRGVEEGRQRGVEEGRIAAQRDMVASLLVQRFGALAPEHSAVVQSASPEALSEMMAKILGADSVDEVVEGCSRGHRSRTSKETRKP